MIIVDKFLQLPSGFREMFLTVVQLGSILSVLVYFRKELFSFWGSNWKLGMLQKLPLWWRIALGVVPAIILGGLSGGAIKEKLYSTQTVALALALGGIALILLERIKRKEKYSSILELTPACILGIGLAQAVAMVPGVSRSAATIIGALCLGASRNVAVEYSFYLAIPTMFAASAYSLLKEGSALSPREWGAVAAGFLTAFLVAWAVIAFFMNYIRHRDFQLFGWYRIILGCLLLFL